MCTKNLNHMMHRSWDMECDRQIFCELRPLFALLHSHNPENQSFEKMKPNIWRYYHFTNLYHKWQSYDAWFLRYGTPDITFCHLDHFLPFYLLKIQNIKILKKWNKKSGYVIISEICITNDNHMMHGSWDMERDRHNFLSLWTIFCPFTHLSTEKIKIIKRWKEFMEILSFYVCSINETHMMYGSCVMEHNRKFFYHFRPFFTLLST